MATVNQILRINHIDPSGVISLMGDVRTFVESKGRAGAMRLIRDLTGEQVVVPVDRKPMIHLTQAIVEGIWKNNQIDRKQLIESSKERIAKMIGDPRNAWMYVEKVEKNIVKQQVSDEVEVSVAVKADGTIKKGGRAILAEELYLKYVVEGTELTSRSALIDLFVKEIGMTPAGASTYVANMKAKHGDPKNLIVAGKKGRQKKD